MSLADRLSTTTQLLDTSVDALETEHDPIEFDERRWASGTRNRRGWIADEYARVYGGKPADFDLRLSDDILQTYGTAKPWKDPLLQDFPGETRAAWMNYKPADRYGDSARSALVPDADAVTDEFTNQLDAMQAELDAAAEARYQAGLLEGKGGGQGPEPNIPDIDPNVFGGWDQGTEMIELGGGSAAGRGPVPRAVGRAAGSAQTTSTGLTVHQVPIRNENDSYIGSDGDPLSAMGMGGRNRLCKPTPTLNRT